MLMVFPFRSPASPRRAKRSRARAPESDPAPAPAAAAPAPVNRRLISGERVLCRCALVLPKHDPFSSYREHREGYIVMNVRGGSLYLSGPFDDSDIARTFPRGKTSTIKGFTLYPEAGRPIVVGDVQARFLKTRIGSRTRGLVLRFVGLDERQLELLNGLPTHFPVVDGEEEAALPPDVRHPTGDRAAGPG